MKTHAIIVLFVFLTIPKSHAEDFRQLLISVEKNIRVEEWSLSGSEFPFKTDSSVSIRKDVLHGGKQEGVDVIHVDNGKLRFTMIPTRGMGIYEVVSGDLRLGWNSPVKEIVHPSFINLSSRGGLGWLEGFNEWMVRCGLEWVGHPGEDKFINNVGDEAVMDLTLHGKVANIPASEVEVVIDEEPPHTIRVRGRVDERMFYGPQLELWTEISTTPGSLQLTVTDRLVNEGADDQEFQMLYHTNFGPPLLEKGAEFVAPIREVTPFNEHAAQSIDRAAVYDGPTPGFVEQVYCMELYAGDDDLTQVMLKNASGNRGVSMSFSVEELPFLTQWKNLPALDAGYVTGIEPGTSFPHNRQIEREKGRVPKLKPGESRQFQIAFEVLPDPSSVQKSLEKIKRIQGGKETKVNRKPEE
ncbi:MAG: aldose 1-epimerase family protein [Candidatus Omnitrophica bacterium]|nr:aldose 1-epimerase family protein [Candidatus Omnitrophota bacterium]